MFLVCGEALWDLFAVEDGDGLSFDAKVGGSPFNVAVGLARLEQRAALLTGISSGPLGRRLAKALQREGVATKFLIDVDLPVYVAYFTAWPNEDGTVEYFHDIYDRDMYLTRAVERTKATRHAEG